MATKVKLYLFETYDYYKCRYIKRWELTEREDETADREAWYLLPDEYTIGEDVTGRQCIYDVRGKKPGDEIGGDCSCEIITERGTPRICGKYGIYTPQRTTEGDEAEEVRKIREQTGMELSEFADAVSIPARTLDNWETGRRKPPFYVIQLLKFWADHKDD